jgi:hypothetical protein
VGVIRVCIVGVNGRTCILFCVVKWGVLALFADNLKVNRVRQQTEKLRIFTNGYHYSTKAVF